MDEKEILIKALDFHDHRCWASVAGVRVGLLALEKLGVYFLGSYIQPTGRFDLWRLGEWYQPGHHRFPSARFHRDHGCCPLVVNHQSSLSTEI